MGIATIEKEGFEADDVIATLVRRLAAEDAEVCIVTSDKDIMQLVGDTVTIVDTMKNTVMERAEVAEKFGIDPALISDFLALSGDASDNIPGVPGIGEKTARELICRLRRPGAIYARLEEIKKPAVRQKLAENRDRARHEQAACDAALRRARRYRPRRHDGSGEPDLAGSGRYSGNWSSRPLKEIKVGGRGARRHPEAASLGRLWATPSPWSPASRAAAPTT